MVVRRFFTVAVLIAGSHLATAQPRLAVEYNGSVEIDCPYALTPHITFEAVAKGAGHSLHIGLRDINENYFGSPVTSLFTGDNCGLFPTIGHNYSKANNLLSSLAVHYSYDSGHWQVCTTAYDGAFVIGQVSYTNGGSSVFAGGCMGTFWAYVEQHITEGLSLIVDYSHAFGASLPCTDYFGLGGRYVFRKAELGLFTDYTLFRDSCEWTTELTLKFNINDHFSIQPTLHAFVQKYAKSAVALIRFSLFLD